MATNRDEIIADFQEHIRKAGGAASDWLVGTAKDTHNPFFRNHIVADLGDGMIYREAFTSTAAQAIRDHFVNDRGLEPDEAERGSDLHAPEPGKIVFIYKRGHVKSPPQATASAHFSPPADQPGFRKRAA
jgi:hypothetical protein